MTAMGDGAVPETKNALWRREEQLRRWDLSETNLVSALPRSTGMVRFQEGCVFLAACSSGDTEEVVRLLSKSADINTSNIDGLTALHQACIDDNLEMVKFLVAHGASINACDNEGWTSLHATSSCGFVQVARYLIDNGADLAAVNNDGELAIDLAEGKEMEFLIMEEMEKQGIDAQAARNEEEERMLMHANQWLNSKVLDDVPHPKTGATALHIAAAKGYIKVIKILIEAGADIEAKDLDGWTPIHAAAHWGQEETCKMLVDNLCNLDVKNNAGQTPLDVADPEIETILEELKKQQALVIQDNELKNSSENFIKENSPTKRRSSLTTVSRKSGDQKANVLIKDVGDEGAHLEALRISETGDEKDEETEGKGSEDSDISKEGSGETLDQKTEKQNQKNSQTTKSKVNGTLHPDPTAAAESSTAVTVEDKPLSSSKSHTPAGGDTDSQSSNVAEKVKAGVDVDVSTTITERSKTTFNKPISDTEDTIPNKRPDSSSAADDTEFKNRRQTDSVVGGGAEHKPSLDVTGVKKPSSSSEEAGTRPTSSFGGPKLLSSSTNAALADIAANSNRRPFEIPKRDDEKEVERKARAKRNRETRRSTQIVNKEDLEKAEEALQAARTGSGDSSRQNEDVKQAAAGVISKPVAAEAPAGSGKFRDSASAVVADSGTAGYPQRTVRNSLPLTGSSSWITTTTSAPVSTSSSVVVMPTKMSSFRSKYLQEKAEEESRIKAEEEARNRAKLVEEQQKEDESSTKSNAASRRRKRESRPLTGRIIVDLASLEGNEKENGDTGNNESDPKTSSNSELSRVSEPVRAGSIDTTTTTTSSSSSSKYGDRSASNIPISSSTSTFTRFPYTSSAGGKDIDYKKLYEEEKAINDQLRKEVKQLQQDSTESKAQLERIRANNGPASSATGLLRLGESKTTESRFTYTEKRALERKISDLEDKVKNSETAKAELRVDNQRLKDENGALIRVISKLSK